MISPDGFAGIFTSPCLSIYKLYNILKQKSRQNCIKSCVLGVFSTLISRSFVRFRFESLFYDFRVVKVIIPLTMSGIFSGSIMVFIPSLGYFFVADILGGGNSDVIGNLIERQFQSGNNWPLGAALSIILILITLLLVKIYQKLGGDMDSLGV